MDGNLQFQDDPETGDKVYGPAAPAAPQTTAGQGSTELVNTLSTQALALLATLIHENVTRDDINSTDLVELRKQYLELQGLGAESDSGEDEDDDSGDTSDSPLLLTATLRFSAKGLSTLLPSDDQAVRTKSAVDLDDIEDPEEREKMTELALDAGKRVEDFYTEYLFERLPVYVGDRDGILSEMGLMGCGIR